ncbi:hypothetical protein [Falsiroseomonas sp. HW251]|uniref:hypothetical protein n=1 Tax=Falsiroseomonas sp. HW251 TaxID=3390998 RepID=UPI003D311390
MYLTVRTYRGTAGRPDDIAHLVKGTLLPMLSGLAGFGAYFVAAAANERTVFATTLFDSREHALAANEQTRAWVVGHLREALPNPPEVIGGEVLHAESVELREGSDSAHTLAIITFGAGGLSLKALEAVQQSVVAGAPDGGMVPGVLSYVTARSESHTDQGVVVLLTSDKDEAARPVHGAVAEELAGTLPSRPEVLEGKVMIAVTSGRIVSPS